MLQEQRLLSFRLPPFPVLACFLSHRRLGQWRQGPGRSKHNKVNKGSTPKPRTQTSQIASQLAKCQFSTPSL